MESQISGLFLYNSELKFNEIEKKLNVRSNKLAYHLKKLISQGILAKKEDIYSLAENSEPIVPYLSEKKAALPVVIIHIGDKNSAFLIKREKRPYQNKVSLPAGRLILGESIEQATKRIMKEKYGIDARFRSLHSISLEHVKKGNKILHSFLLIFVSANSKNIRLTNIEKSRKNIIKSDYLLLKKHLSLSAKIHKINSKT